MGTEQRAGGRLSLTGRTGGGLAARLDAWVAEARVDEAARARGRERWMLELAEQEATLGGVLLDLAERAEPVVVRTAAGRVHQGEVDLVGSDFVALRIAEGVALVPHRAVTLVRTAPGAAAPVGARGLRSEVGLAEVLRELAADRERAMVVLADGGEAVRGALHAVGADVLTLRVDGDPPARVHVPLSAVGEVLL